MLSIICNLPIFIPKVLHPVVNEIAFDLLIRVGVSSTISIFEEEIYLLTEDKSGISIMLKQCCSCKSCKFSALLKCFFFCSPSESNSVTAMLILSLSLYFALNRLCKFRQTSLYSLLHNHNDR